MTSMTETAIPGYVAGTWTIDPVHSDVSFTVKHMMVSKVRGHFRTFSGTLVTSPDINQSSVTAEIDLASFNTNNEQRDAHIRSKDFFEVETHPTMTFRSTGIRADGEAHVIDGELTLHGVTKSVPLAVEINGFAPDAYGGYRAGFSAGTVINRNDFGIDIKMPMDGGGVVIGDKINVHLEIEAVLDQPTA